MIKKIICFLKRRHKLKFMRANHSKYHQFYDVNGGGHILTCNYCGTAVFFRGEDEMNKIPHMGAHTIGAALEQYAAAAAPGTAIVELGCWLGAGTYHLAKGCSGKGVEVHTYDIFQTKGNEVDKAAAQGVKLVHGRDTLPLVKESLKEFDNITFHKTSIKNETWNGPKISVHVDDACKLPKEFKHAIKTFSPFWIPGKTIVVLMDYFYFEHRPDIPELKYQLEFVHKNIFCFDYVEYWESCSCAAFRYMGGDLILP